jgi:hypothetical protein
LEHSSRVRSLYRITAMMYGLGILRLRNFRELTVASQGVRAPSGRVDRIYNVKS